MINLETKLCWRLLIKCHNLNKSVIKGRPSTSYSNRIYKQKELLIRECLHRIGENNLPIKVSYEESDVSSQFGLIIYFDYLGKQVSFHMDWYTEEPDLNTGRLVSMVNSLESDYGKKLKKVKNHWNGIRQGLLHDPFNKIPAKNPHK